MIVLLCNDMHDNWNSFEGCLCASVALRLLEYLGGLQTFSGEVPHILLELSTSDQQAT